MSERFKDLKKIPAVPAARILAVANVKLETPVSTPVSADVSAVLADLEGNKAWPDMIRLLSVALPAREAVWWACIAARDIVGDDETPCVKAASAWVFEPNDANRAAVQAALDSVDMDDDTSLCATAALYAPGTLGLGDMNEQPAPPGAVSSCVFAMNIVAAAETDDINTHMELVIDRAVDIARGGNGSIKVNAGAAVEA